MRVAVIGAGMAGLTAALRLTQAGHQCDVYERWPGLGGQVATIDVGDGVLLERYYHHLFTSDVHIAELYRELGLPDELEFRPSTVGFYCQGALHPFDGPRDLLRFRPLSLTARIRMGLAVLWVQRSRRGVEAYEGTTAWRWIQRAMGSQAWDTVWGPLLRGKFGDRAKDISMAWLWAKFTTRRRLEGDEARQELLGYPKGSWEPLLRALADRIEEGGGRVLIDRPARSIGREGTNMTVTPAAEGAFRRGHDPAAFEADGPAERYDAILATVPNDVFEGLLEPEVRESMAPGYLERLHRIDYHAALCLLLELDRPFGPFYWTNVADRDLPFVGLIEHTNFIEPARYGGRRFLYVANYVDRADELLSLDAEQLFERYLPGLHSVNADFDPGWVRNRWIFREPAAQPIVDVGYAERIPPLRTGVPGLVLANTTQIYPEDRGTNYAVRLGSDAAAELMAAARERLTGDQVGAHPGA
ncbi:MAG: NAD(P)/FAD-dependent oxidoreductase [Solirubrobacterales bacterium]